MTAPEDALRAGVSRPGPSFRGALVSRDFTLLFVGQLAAGIGNGLIVLALPWLVLQITGSAFQLGFAYFFQFLPMLLFGLVGGVFADRWDRRLTIVVVDTVRGGAFLSVAALYYVDSAALRVEHLYAVIFLESTLANFFNPARTALFPNLVSPDNLRAANSLMELPRQIGFIIAGIGGAMVAVLGPAALFLVDGATFWLSASTCFLIKWRQPSREAEQSDGLWHSLQLVALETGEGIGVISRAKLLQVAVILGLALNLIVAPIQVLLPLFVREIKNAEADYFGLLVVGLLLGSIAGLLGGPAASRRLGLGRMTIVAVLGLGIVISVAVWPPTDAPPVIAMFFAGMAIGSLQFAQTTLIQASTSDEERGRVSSIYYTATLGARPFAFLTIGAVASAVADIRLLFVALGILALLIGLVLARMPEVREAH